jgi:hypothetical protein
MAGKSNHEGKKHTRLAKSRISIKRGDYDPIGDKRWIVNINGKTYRRKKAPEGYKLGQRNWNEEFIGFAQFLEQSDQS